MIEMFSRRMTKALRCKIALVSTVFASGALLCLGDAPSEKSLSINFAAGQGQSVSRVYGNGEYGAYPVKGDLWNNIVWGDWSRLTDQTGLIWSDGESVDGVSFSCYGGTWGFSSPGDNNILSTFLCYPGEANTGVKLSGLPRDGGYTLYIICGCDWGTQFLSPAVNGTHYTAVNGKTVVGNADWGDISKSMQWVLAEGVTFLKIENLQLDDGELRINSEFSTSRNSGLRGTIAALQLVHLPPQVKVACDGSRGTVSMGGGAPTSSVMTNADFGVTISTTLSATPAPDYKFVRWEGDTSIISEGTATDAEVAIETAGRCQLNAVFERLKPSTYVLSINFAAGQGQAVSRVYGNGEYGAYPVKGDLWNNVVSGDWSRLTDQTGLIWSDGESVDGVLFSCYGGIWGFSPPSDNNILNTYLCFPGEANTGVKLSGLPRDGAYTLYIICSADWGTQFISPAVNGTHYTAVNGKTVVGNADWGDISKSMQWVLAEGVTFLKIENLQLDDGELRINSDFTSDRNSRLRGTIAALQLVHYPPQVKVACDGSGGTVSMGGGAPTSSVTTNADFGVTISTTLAATPAPGYRFVRWEGDTSIISEGTATDAEVDIETAGRHQLNAVFELIDPYTYVLSVNFSGGCANDNMHCAVSGTETYGAFPVTGNNWNNISTHVTNNYAALKWNDGFVLSGITESNTANNNWALLASASANNLFYSYLDDGSRTTFTGFTRERGFPSTCTVYIYNSTDSKNIAFLPMSVNGVAYTFAGGEVKPGTANWGAAAKAQSNTLELGGNYLAIENVPVPADGTLVITPHGAGNVNVARCGVAAIQVAFEVPSTFTVQASCDAAMGAVQFGTDEPGAAVAVTGTHATEFSTTLRAIPAEGYAFSHWTGGTAAIDGGADGEEVTVRTQLPIELTAVFVLDTVPLTATWTGRGTRGDLSDPANWDCRNRSGGVIDGALPTDRTDITVSGAVTFDWPTGQTLAYRSLTVACELADDCDWCGFGAAGFMGTVDLKGHALSFCPVGGTGTITDTSADAPGELHVAVAEGASMNNTAISFAGNLRLVKEGAGTLTVSKANQSYTGGTEVAGGSLVLGTALHPMGTGDGTRDVVVRKGATIDINHCYNATSCVYNYIDLAGTIRISGNNASDAWSNDNFWHNAISLADDATITGGWFFFGHNRTMRMLTLNGHTLTLNLTTGEAYVSNLETDETGGSIVVNAGSIQTSYAKFSSVDVDFTGNGYVFLAGNCPARDFSYAFNKWCTHASATQVFVDGTYTAGPNRPPVTLNNGATLDLSAQTGVWSAKGQESVSGSNNRTFVTPGKVSFGPGVVQVKLGARDFPPYLKVKIVDWDGVPAGVTFKPLTETRARIVLKAMNDGLYAYNEGGSIIIVR